VGPLEENKMEFKRGYETIIEENNLEMRVYSPVKRTLPVFGLSHRGIDTHFLPFPYVVFTRVNRCDNRWFLFVRLMGEEKPKIPKEIPLGVFDYRKFKKNRKGQAIDCFPCCGPGAACLDVFYHHGMPHRYTFDEMISAFWNAPFPTYLGSSTLKRVGGSFRAWEKLTVDEVVKIFKKQPAKLGANEQIFDNFYYFIKNFNGGGYGY
jgi:hypothetical protein